MKAVYSPGQRRAPLPEPDAGTCPSVMDYPTPYLCTRPTRHRGRHEATGADGEWVLAEWDDAGAVPVVTP